MVQFGCITLAQISRAIISGQIKNPRQVSFTIRLVEQRRRLPQPKANATGLNPVQCQYKFDREQGNPRYQTYGMSRQRVCRQ
jgi:hypothetical protein